MACRERGNALLNRDMNVDSVTVFVTGLKEEMC